MEEANLSRNIFVLRRALGETEQERYIITVPGRGYRLAEDVRAVPGEELTGVAASGSRAEAAGKKMHFWKWTGAAAVVLLATAAAATWLGKHARGAPRAIAALGRDTVILADFDNSTGDPVFDETLRRGLAIQLEQSPVLAVASDERVHKILELMGRSGDGHLPPALAYEVCERAGSAAVLEGSIRPIGNQYVLALTAKSCRDGAILDEEQLQAARKEDVLNVLRNMAVSFRTRIGESLTTIERSNTPISEASTTSLEALKAYSMGWKVVSTTGAAASAPLFLRAVEIDPRFAMAYAMLGRVYSDLGESDLSAHNTTKAWQLRDRTSGWERFFIEASYDVQVTGNVEKAQQTCEAWSQTYPRDIRPYGFLSGMIYPVQGRFPLAVEKSRKMIDYDPDLAYAYNILALSEMATGNLSEAERILRSAEERKLTIPDIYVDRYQLAFIKNDELGLARIASETPRDSGAEDWIAHLQSTVLAYSGHLQQATKMSERAIALAQHSGEMERSALFQSEQAIRDALFENKQLAVLHANSALRLSRGRDVEYGAAFALGFAGNLSRAGDLANDLEARFPEDTAVQFIYVPELRALIALKHNQPAKAIELL